MNSRTSIHELIGARHRELTLRVKQLRSELVEAETELVATSAAAEAVGLDLNKEHRIDQASENIEPENEPPYKLMKPISLKTMKQAALEILEKEPNGLTSSEIIEVMNHRFRMPYPRSSLSPQLSRLKHEGAVVQYSGKWLLPKYANNVSAEK